MPNWCYNSAIISHENPAKIDELIAVAEARNMFNHFIPLPDGKWDYDWCVNNWGTKWEASEPTHLSRESPTELLLNFDTAWAPPIRVFEAMQAAGYTVQSEYTEEGMWFAGQWDDGKDECYKIEDLPEHLSHLKPTEWEQELEAV